jgi:hypothetical protein
LHTKLTTTVRKAQWAAEEPEPGLCYIVIDVNLSKSKLSDALQFINKPRRAGILICANDLKESVLGYYPFPLSIRNPESVYRFYNGELLIYVAVDCAYVNDMIEDKGIKIEFTNGVWKLEPVLPDSNWGALRFVASCRVACF